MPDSPDLEDLARKYMNLWQEHLNALAGNQDAANVMAQTMAMMSSGAQAFADAAGASAPPSPEGGNDSTSDRPPSTAHSDGDTGPDVADLNQRLTALEERVAELESRTSGHGIATGKGHRENKS